MNQNVHEQDQSYMPAPNPAALEFLLTRRSRPAKTLAEPAPDRKSVETILQAGARSPDHGILEPWRFLVLERAALDRLADLAENRAVELSKPDDQIEKARNSFANAPLSIAIVFSPKQSEKIPHEEQVMSAGAVCLSALNAALALGWGANWVTGWAAFDAPFLKEGLGLSESEYVAGFIHLGTETVAPADRKRPDLDQLVEWVNT